MNLIKLLTTTHTKLLTGKPGNINEFMEDVKEKKFSKVTVLYWARSGGESAQGFGTIMADITYKAGDIKIVENWDNKYGSVADGKQRETMIDSLKNQAKKNISIMKDNGVFYEEIVDVPYSFR